MTITAEITTAQPAHDAGQALRELVGAIHDIHPGGNPVYASPHIIADPRWARLTAAMQAARATLDAVPEPAFDLIAHMHRQIDFSRRTFGPDARMCGGLIKAHTVRQAQEIVDKVKRLPKGDSDDD